MARDNQAIRVTWSRHAGGRRYAVWQGTRCRGAFLGADASIRAHRFAAELIRALRLVQV